MGYTVTKPLLCDRAQCGAQLKVDETGPYWQCKTCGKTER